MTVKQPMINTMKTGGFDNLPTPRNAVMPLFNFLTPILLPRGSTVWECADPGGSNITKIFKEGGYNVISTDIQTGYDFFIYEPKERVDIIITNPPYSLKDEFIERCYELEIPFAMLMPLTTLEGIRRGKIFRGNNISLLVLDRRVSFTGQKNNWYNVSWFLGNCLEDNLIFFETVEKE